MPGIHLKSGKEESVEIANGEEVMIGSVGETGSGAYLVGADCEFRANRRELAGLRSRDAGPKVWEHTMNMFYNVRR